MCSLLLLLLLPLLNAACLPKLHACHSTLPAAASIPLLLLQGPTGACTRVRRGRRAPRAP